MFETYSYIFDTYFFYLFYHVWQFINLFFNYRKAEEVSSGSEDDEEEKQEPADSEAVKVEEKTEENAEEEKVEKSEA